LELVSVSAALIQDRPYEKVVGTAVAAPLVDVGIAGLVSGSPEVQFTARIDTGADISCVPRSAAEKLMPLLLGRPVLVRSHDGSVCRAWTYRVSLTVYGWPDEDVASAYRPSKGVLLTDSEIGLIGMDIIREWDLSLERSGLRFSVCYAEAVAMEVMDDGEGSEGEGEIHRAAGSGSQLREDR
jgi:hypothetical protein